MSELQPDPAQPITPREIEESEQILIERQETYLNSLVKRLREPRIRHIIEPILAGQSLSDLPADDLRLALDLGLVRSGDGGGIVIANPIYREVIPTMLAYVTRAFLPQIAPTWLNADGTLNPDKLLDSFLTFWRQHGQPLLKSVHYHEIAPHIVLMAFLHRVVNGGGSLECEYGLGRGRTDLLVIWHYPGGVQRIVLELKVLRKSLAQTITEGLAQTLEYGEGCDADELHFVVFDRSKKPWSKKIFKRTRKHRGITIKVWGM
ncbi:MAG: hypothetical protein JMDDDDMK_00439 [Acidobacteria bacterium]|nr:hypothetical protein [Acidobacteriota bacterium]